MAAQDPVRMTMIKACTQSLNDGDHHHSHRVLGSLVTVKGAFKVCQNCKLMSACAHSDVSFAYLLS